MLTIMLLLLLPSTMMMKNKHEKIYVMKEHENAD